MGKDWLLSLVMCAIYKLQWAFNRLPNCCKLWYWLVDKESDYWWFCWRNYSTMMINDKWWLLLKMTNRELLAEYLASQMGSPDYPEPGLQFMNSIKILLEDFPWRFFTKIFIKDLHEKSSRKIFIKTVFRKLFHKDFCMKIGLDICLEACDSDDVIIFIFWCKVKSLVKTFWWNIASQKTLGFGDVIENILSKMERA